MRTYREILFAYNGPGPWGCDFCGFEILAEDLDIHHRDEDKKNNDPDNLGASHRTCHASHHSSKRGGWNHSEDAKKRIATFQSGRRHTEESKKKMSLARKGKPNPEQAERVRQAWKDGKYANRGK